jgi:DNA-binding CsgD family transcriptional regulator
LFRPQRSIRGRGPVVTDGHGQRLYKRRPTIELTPAERQAAELTATGLSSKQIARRLSVSAHTVGARLSQAYRKLGIRSRAELAGRLAAPG